MVKLIYLFVLFFITLYYINYKHSKGIRVIAFKEEESTMEIILSFIATIVISFLWALYFVLF